MSEQGSNPLISVALCTFNGAVHLREQVDSLLAQTYTNLEVVAVDDCSTDATRAMLEDYQRHDPRLRVLVNASNLGFKRNFAFAISQCRGEFIAPCDQDDIWDTDKLNKLFATIGNSSLVFCDSELIDAQGYSLGRATSDWWRMQDTRDPMVFVMDNCVSGHAMLFRRELLNWALPIPDGIFYDWWLAAVAASQAGIVYCPKKLVRYRQHGGNVTNILRERRHGARPTGVGQQKINDIRTRLTRLVAVAGLQQPLLDEFHRLWTRHATDWFSWRLMLFMTTHRRRIFALSPRSPIKVLQKAVTHVVGVRTLRLFKPRKYAM